MSAEAFNPFSEDPNIPEDIRAMLREMGVEIMGDEQIVGMMMPYLEKLGQLCAHPEDLLEELDDLSHTIGLDMADLVADPVSEVDKLLEPVQEWTLRTVALCLMVTQGAFGDPRIFATQLTSLSGRLPELNLGLLSFQQQDQPGSQDVLELVQCWMDCRENCQFLISQVG